ncbi:shikimate kinase [Legionella quinlivanii]|uniref:Shikimate kinase n=1 Tax=Legionella quinlivanii TaxID=45073 RepID=A0A0W0XLZ5_9GAMM|nr:AAA family ATPase [Legionella quinlivanii]KTD45460.1 shikimate kinase [Legionella quinlivanii]SEG33144.1 Predicted kinase [Legionella quinlivanii DSM 21216]STY10551.1 shikimate kinase [Legionella quinlivanii]
MLIILGGLPGTGKSTIARQLAKTIEAVYLRIDSIEQAIKNASQYSNQGGIQVIAEGYMTAYAIAKDNLEIGLTVVTDSVNPVEITREAYRKIAREMNKPYLEIEIICSDKAIHKERVETRQINIQGLTPPTWQEVLDRDYELWESKKLTIDTAIHTPEQAIKEIIARLGQK